MTTQEQRSMSARAEVFKALGHPARLGMVIALGQGERCVCELQEVVGSDMSTVSKHLTILRNVGVVETEKRGKQVYYRLRVPCVLNFIHCVEELLATNATEHTDV